MRITWRLEAIGTALGRSDARALHVSTLPLSRRVSFSGMWPLLNDDSAGYRTEMPNARYQFSDIKPRLRPGRPPSTVMVL